MRRQRNEKSIELKLLQLVDKVVPEPEQKAYAVRLVKQLLHASEIADVKGLHKVIDKLLGSLLRGGLSDLHNDD